jgi:CBS-domain-containing membrane protein
LRKAEAQETLQKMDLVTRMVAASRLRTCLSAVVGGLVLLALAVFVVLVNVVVPVITLAIFATIVFLLALSARRLAEQEEAFRRKVGR